MQKLIISLAVTTVSTQAIRLESQAETEFGLKSIANAALAVAPPHVQAAANAAKSAYEAIKEGNNADALNSYQEFK